MGEVLVKCQSSFFVVGNPSAANRSKAARRTDCTHGGVAAFDVNSSKGATYDSTALSVIADAVTRSPSPQRPPPRGFRMSPSHTLCPRARAPGLYRRT